MGFGFFGFYTCRILAPLPGIKPAPPALEAKVLTTGPAEKSLYSPSGHSLPLPLVSLLVGSSGATILDIYFGIFMHFHGCKPFLPYTKAV